MTTVKHTRMLPEELVRYTIMDSALLDLRLRVPSGREAALEAKIRSGDWDVSGDFIAGIQAYHDAEAVRHSLEKLDLDALLASHIVGEDTVRIPSVFPLFSRSKGKIPLGTYHAVQETARQHLDNGADRYHPAAFSFAQGVYSAVGSKGLIGLSLLASLEYALVKINEEGKKFNNVTSVETTNVEHLADGSYIVDVQREQLAKSLEQFGGWLDTLQTMTPEKRNSIIRAACHRDTLTTLGFFYGATQLFGRHVSKVEYNGDPRSTMDMRIHIGPGKQQYITRPAHWFARALSVIGVRHSAHVADYMLDAGPAVDSVYASIGDIVASDEKLQVQWEAAWAQLESIKAALTDETALVDGQGRYIHEVKKALALLASFVDTTVDTFVSHHEWKLRGTRQEVAQQLLEYTEDDALAAHLASVLYGTHELLVSASAAVDERREHYETLPISDIMQPIIENVLVAYSGVSIQYPDDVDYHVHGSKSTLAASLLTLVQNAVEASSGGSVSIEYDVVDDPLERYEHMTQMTIIQSGNLPDRIASALNKGTSFTHGKEGGSGKGAGLAFHAITHAGGSIEYLALTESYGGKVIVTLPAQD